MQIAQLPSDALQLICEHLPAAADVLTLSATCKAAHEALDEWESDFLWKPLWRARFPRARKASGLQSHR